MLYSFYKGENDSEDDENIYDAPVENTITTELEDKDNIMRFLLPDNINECMGGIGPVCSSKKTIDSLSKIYNVKSNDPIQILDTAKKETNCKTEKCVLNSLSDKVPSAQSDLQNRFKISGPTNTTLLNNVIIDDLMNKWSNIFTFFFAYNFNMKDYMKYSFRNGYVKHSPDTLATISFNDLKEKYKCCGCIINSDNYHGSGKHWMALFADWRNKIWTIEFFNSSGNAPAAEWISWMTKMKNEMEEYNNQCKIIRVSSVRHQQSKSECGIYSLFYVWSRLNNVSYTYFKNPIPDQFMFEFRHHIFESDIDKFDWVEYNKKTNIKWEI